MIIQKGLKNLIINLFKKPFKRALLSMALGLLTLGVVDLLAELTGVYIPVTWLTMGTSLVGGIPGVALLVLLSAF